MASGPITSWQTDEETMETVRDFILGGSKITADGDCSHEIKKILTPWEKSYDQTRQYIKKQRYYFANKGLSSQGYGFSRSHVWIWELEYKKAEHWRTDAFELWCWRRPLRVPWTARRSNQFILKEISPEYSLEELLLNWKLQYFGHLMWRINSFEKTLMLGKMAGGEGDDRGRDSWMATRTQWVWAWINSRSWWWTGRPGVLQSMGSQRVRHDWATKLNWWCQMPWS